MRRMLGLDEGSMARLMKRLPSETREALSSLRRIACRLMKQVQVTWRLLQSRLLPKPFPTATLPLLAIHGSR